VVVIFIDSVSRARFLAQFPRTVALLRRLNRTDATALFNYPLYHSLPCCTKNWVYPALSGHFNPARNGEYSPETAGGVPWIWQQFEKAGYVTHVGNDVCYPSELQDWWMSEASPKAPNISDHPLLDAFCTVKPLPRSTAPGGGRVSFESRWDGVQYATAMDSGSSICVAGETLMRRFLQHALRFLMTPAYSHTPKFAFTALNDVHCRCRTGGAHVDLETEWFLNEVTPLLSSTVVMLVSDHGLLDSFERPAPDLHLPLLSLLVPRSLLRASPATARALGLNQERLVAPFDIHSTLLSLSAIGGSAATRRPRPSSGNVNSAPATARADAPMPRWGEFRDKFNAHGPSAPMPYSSAPSGGPFGASLLQTIAEGRGCKEAGIPRSACRFDRSAG